MRFLSSFTFLFFLSGLLYAQNDSIVNLEKKSYQTQRIIGTAPSIDGVLNDEAWNQVEWGGDFVQRHPYEGKKPSQETKFKILYDEKNLYVAIRCFDDEPDKIEKRLGRRDDFPGDIVEINIDSYFDHTTAFSFTVSASGVKGDEAVTNNGNNWDSSWDPVWYVKTSIDDLGWNAEMRIPLSQVRFNYKPAQVWGIQVFRRLFRKDEVSIWQFIPKNAPGWVHLFGELHGLEEVKPQKQIEIQPYVVTKIEKSPKNSDNPYNAGTNAKLSAGMDGKIGLSSNFTLDFTFNPDFGQVEADPSVVNLSGFQNFFGEKRPFFIEGKNIYDYQISSSIAWGDHNSDNLFYSRRIGRKPHIHPNLEDGEHIKNPENTAILGALKLSGRTSKGWSFGILESLTNREYAKISNEESERRVIVEPLTNYFVGRVQKDYNNGNTRIGSILTMVNRKIEDSEMKQELHNAAYTGGIDFIHNWKDRTYYVSGNLIFSHLRGSESSITKIQENHEHYFQRANANHINVNTSLNSLSGYAATLKAGRGGNSVIRFQGGFTLRSPGADFNDMGFMRSADLINQFFWAGYNMKNPTKVLRNFSFNVNEWSYWDYSGQNTYNAGNFNTNLTFINYWSFGMGVTHHLDMISNSDLRGGPSLIYPAGTWYWYNLSSDMRKKLRFSYSHEFYKGNKDFSQKSYLSATLRYQPFNALNVSISPSYSGNNNEMQYVETVDIEGGKGYIVSSISQKTLSTSLRVNYSINPTLTIQYYGQPFVSKGEYNKFKRISDAKASEYENRFYRLNGTEMMYNPDEENYYVMENATSYTYNFSNPDYNFVQFKFNLVMRWEYLPGSTLFLVWSENRFDNPDINHPSMGDLSKKLWKATTYDVFLLKLSYRFLN